MDGGGLITNDNNEYKEKRDRIKRLEEKILILQNELDRLNKDLKEKKSSKV
jgi:peptidoglycan hydrolase CwlO-like protein